MSENPHLACPFEECASSDAFSWNSDKQIGKCHSCERGYPSAKMPKVFDWVEGVYPLKEKEVHVVKAVASSTFKGIRGLHEHVAQLYGIA